MKNITVVIAAALLALCGCQRGSNGNAGRPRIALVLKTLNNPYFIDMQRGAEEAAGKLGVDLIVQAAEREIDVDKQLQIVENLIQSKVDAICITPSGSREIVPAVLKANQAHIPVVIVDTRVDAATLKEAGGVVAAFIGSDNFEGGKLAGEFIIKALSGKGNVAILEGIPGHETGDSRLRGFHAVVDGQTGLKVVASQPANWERDQGFNVFQNILQSHPDLKAVFACSDLMALGAVEAIRAAKRDNIIVVGFDAFSEAQDAVKAGTMHATIAQSPSTMGALAVENALHALRGEPLQENIQVHIKLVTKENAS